MIHFQPAAIQPDFVQKVFGMGYPFFGSEISFQEMAVSHFSAADHDGVGTGLKGLQNMQDIHLAGAQ